MCIRAIIFEEHCKSQGYWGDYPGEKLEDIENAFLCTNDYLDFFKYLRDKCGERWYFNELIDDLEPEECPEYFCTLSVGEYDARKSIDI